MVVYPEVGCVPPLIGAGVGLVCESVGKADMISANFDGKQSRDLDSDGGTDPLGMFPLFSKRTVEVLAPFSLWYFGGSLVW